MEQDNEEDTKAHEQLIGQLYKKPPIETHSNQVSEVSILIHNVFTFNFHLVLTIILFSCIRFHELNLGIKIYFPLFRVRTDSSHLVDSRS